MRRRLTVGLVALMLCAGFLMLARGPSAGAASSTLAPVADSYVQATKPTSNFGTSTSLVVDNSPATVSYLRFDVGGLTSPPTKVTLKVFAPTSTSTPIIVRPVADNNWTETGLTYNNRPAAGTEGIASPVPIKANSIVSFDVTALVTRSGLRSFALDTASSSSKSLPSRENPTVANRPQLVIETGASASPTPLPSSTTTGTTTATPSPTGTTVTPTSTATATATNTATATASASATPTATTSATATTPAGAVLGPVADSYVSAELPASNFGGAAGLKVDGSPVLAAYLKFHVQGLTAAPAKATLRVLAQTASSSTTPVNLRPVADTAWEEATLTNANKPVAGFPIIQGPTSWLVDSWLSYDVTTLVKGNGLVSFALETTSGTSKTFASRETAYSPQLVLETGTSTPTASASATPTVTGTATPTELPTSSEPPSTDPVVAAAGDIACKPGSSAGTSCQHKAVSDAILGDTAVGTVLALGDLQYEQGTLEAFQQAYDPTWGRFKEKTRPIPGNHEYETAGATGYYSYFGAAAGDPTKGYYSFDVGDWHFVALNSQVDIGATGAQAAWLKADLAAHPNKCVAALTHYPRWSTGLHGNHPGLAPFYQILYDANADLILSGHDHHYERFYPLDPLGVRDDARGLVQIVSGLGGKNHYPVSGGATTVTKDNTGYGYSRLVLHPDSADISFVSAVGTYADTYRLTCH